MEAHPVFSIVSRVARYCSAMETTVKKYNKNIAQYKKAIADLQRRNDENLGKISKSKKLLSSLKNALGK